jgi:hypothetical protein
MCWESKKRLEQEQKAGQADSNCPAPVYCSCSCN